MKSINLKGLILLSTFFLSGCTTLSVSEFNFTPKEYPVDAIQKMLDAGEKVVLAIVVERIENIPLMESGKTDVFKSWAKGIEVSLITAEEDVFLKCCGKHENFTIVDRNSINKIEEEYMLQMAGYTRNIDILRLGELLNATHLFVISFARYRYNGFYYNFSDEVQGRLVGVKDGRVYSVGRKTSLLK